LSGCHGVADLGGVDELFEADDPPAADDEVVGDADVDGLALRIAQGVALRPDHAALASLQTYPLEIRRRSLAADATLSTLDTNASTLEPAVDPGHSCQPSRLRAGGRQNLNFLRPPPC
jgi:hypothetical protein